MASILPRIRPPSPLRQMEKSPVAGPPSTEQACKFWVTIERNLGTRNICLIDPYNVVI